MKFSVIILHTQPVCSDADIRLVNGTSPNEGIVELCSGEVWLTVSLCDANLDRNNALVACRQLGLPTDSK